MKKYLIHFRSTGWTVRERNLVFDAKEAPKGQEKGGEGEKKERFATQDFKNPDVRANLYAEVRAKTNALFKEASDARDQKDDKKAAEKDAHGVRLINLLNFATTVDPEYKYLRIKVEEDFKVSGRTDGKSPDQVTKMIDDEVKLRKNNLRHEAADYVDAAQVLARNLDMILGAKPAGGKPDVVPVRPAAPPAAPRPNVPVAPPMERPVTPPPAPVAPTVRLLPVATLPTITEPALAKPPVAAKAPAKDAKAEAEAARLAAIATGMTDGMKANLAGGPSTKAALSRKPVSTPSATTPPVSRVDTPPPATTPLAGPPAARVAPPPVQQAAPVARRQEAPRGGAANPALFGRPDDPSNGPGPSVSTTLSAAEREAAALGPKIPGIATWPTQAPREINMDAVRDPDLAKIGSKKVLFEHEARTRNNNTEKVPWIVTRLANTGDDRRDFNIVLKKYVNQTS